MADGFEQKLPPIPVYPPQQLINQLSPEEWQSCLNLWIQSIELRLRLNDNAFRELKIEAAVLTYVESYLETQPQSPVNDLQQQKLHKFTFLLLKRLLLSHAALISSSKFLELVGNGSTVFGSVKDWRTILQSLHRNGHLRKSVQTAKSLLRTASSPASRQTTLDQLTSLIKCLPAVAAETMAGADYLESLIEFYSASDVSLQQATTTHTFYAFMALLTEKHTTMLTDNIWHMKSEADRLSKTSKDKGTLLSSLLCTTSFLRHFAADKQIAMKQVKMLESLKSYKENMLQYHAPSAQQRSFKRKLKGKEKASAAAEQMHMHKASQISQIHELFPHLTAGHIMKILDHFSDDVEAATAALLEPESLPDGLKAMHIDNPESDLFPELTDLVPRSTPPMPPERRNVFDNDDFDRLHISSNQFQKGKKQMVLDDSITSAEHARSKAAILSALASFDSDDDERDDTYDVADVGGAVDNTLDVDTRPKTAAGDSSSYDDILFKTWQEHPEIFARDSSTRASNIRAQLRREANMSDEQIEGWAIMLNRDPRLIDRLQQKYSAARTFGGNQRALQSTKWQANSSADNSEAETEGGASVQNDGRRIGQAEIRGHRTFNRGRGRDTRSTGGPADDLATQRARKSKEQGRGRGGANHRRDARAKKIAKGMGPAAP